MQIQLRSELSDNDSRDHFSIKQGAPSTRARKKTLCGRDITYFLHQRKQLHIFHNFDAA